MSKLQEIKNNGVRLLGMDWDETMVSSKVFGITPRDAVALFVHIAERGIVPVVLTARGVTMERILAREMVAEEIKDKAKRISIYLGGCDGRYLARFTDGKKEETLYSYELTDTQINIILQIYRDNPIDSPDEKAVTMFRGLLADTWDPAILPPEYIIMAKEFDGRLHIEPSKLTLAGPTDRSLFPKVVKKLNEAVSSYDLTAGWGGKDQFIHIRPAFNEDGKVKAVKTVMEKFNITEDHVATFGDAPLGNDKGMLSMKYGFTNDMSSQGKQPPYVLSGKTPIHAIHEAIKLIVATRH